MKEMIMRTKYLLIIAAFISVFTSCKNADDFQDVIYFTGTETTPTAKFTVDGPADMGLSISTSSKVENDIKVQIKANPDLLDSYNQLNGKVYQILPAECYELSSSDITIAAGKCVSKPVRLSITSVESFEEGVTYCLPLSIVNVEGNLPVLESSRTVYVVVNQTIITKAAVTTGTYFLVPFDKDPNLKNVAKVTMEARLYVNNFQSRNPYISSVMGIEENFLLRFGDVNIDKDQLQLAGGGFPITGTIQFETNRWYHVAVTYDGAEIKLYINGELNGTTPAPRGNIDLASDKGFYIGRSAGSRFLDGAISEVRVWTKALSASEIANNMCYVDPTSDGLLAYWRFNEGEGNEIRDWSGHGWELTGTRVGWKEGVRCPDSE